mmetsp:Transcript_33524/g.58728  ORF Transcript_33524/g.58728 Transcript_33524/m.58728 type:complete len:249 (+) Transcript_33524:27-773(+)
MIKQGSPASHVFSTAGQSPAASPNDHCNKPEHSLAASFSFHDITNSLDISADVPSKAVSRILEFDSDESSFMNLQSSQRSLPLFYANYSRHSKHRSFGDEVVNSQGTVRVRQKSMYSIGSVIDFAKPQGHQRMRSSIRSSQELKSSFNITNTSHAVKSSLTSDLNYSPDVTHIRPEPQRSRENSVPEASTVGKSCTFDGQPFTFEKQVRGSAGIIDQSLGCHPAKTYCPQCDKVVLTDVTMQLPEVDL